MTQTSNPPTHMANPAAVVSPHFLAPYPVVLTIFRKLLSFSNGNFAVTDVNGNAMFQVKSNYLTLRDRRVLLDPAGNPILSFHKKLFSVYNRWVVFRGDSSYTKDIIFSVERSSLIQYRTSLDVFLAVHKKENACDFKVKGSWFGRSCTIYAGETNTIVAQMHQKRTIQSIAFGKETYSLTVYPNVDYAFVVTLVVILHEIYHARSNRGGQGDGPSPST